MPRLQPPAACCSPPAACCSPLLHAAAPLLQVLPRLGGPVDDEAALWHLTGTTETDLLHSEWQGANHSLRTTHSLLTAHSSLLTTHYSPLTTHHSPRTTHTSRPTEQARRTGRATSSPSTTAPWRWCWRCGARRACTMFSQTSSASTCHCRPRWTGRVGWMGWTARRTARRTVGCWRRRGDYSHSSGHYSRCCSLQP